MAVGASEEKISIGKVIFALKAAVSIATIIIIFASIYLMHVDDSVYISSILMMAGYAIDIYELMKTTDVSEKSQKYFNKVAFISNFIGMSICLLYTFISLSDAVDVAVSMPAVNIICNIIVSIVFCFDGVFFVLNLIKSQ